MDLYIHKVRHIHRTYNHCHRHDHQHCVRVTTYYLLQNNKSNCHIHNMSIYTLYMQLEFDFDFYFHCIKFLYAQCTIYNFINFIKICMKIWHLTHMSGNNNNNQYLLRVIIHILIYSQFSFTHYCFGILKLNLRANDWCFINDEKKLWKTFERTFFIHFLFKFSVFLVIFLEEFFSRENRCFFSGLRF